MNHFRVHIAVFSIALVAFLLVILFDARTSRGQSQDAGGPSSPVGSRVKTTSLIRDRRAKTGTESASPSAAFAPAAMRNSMLSTELNWTFGGKQQRGWYLYAPLINRLLDTEHDMASDSFAAALARWQQQSGLRPSGVLDEESLYAMVTEWQARRLQSRSPAQPNQLVTAPASDFYHPTRPEELRQVERETYAAYKRMVGAAIADPSLGLASTGPGELAPAENYLKILSPFRTRAYQEQLRRLSPNAGRAGLAINSPHFTGRALDLYVGGDPVDTSDANRALQVRTRVYQWLVRNAERFGFRPYYYEPWHWEYVK